MYMWEIWSFFYVFIYSEEDLNAKNSGGYTPLMYAAYIGHDNVVNMLIDAQVDVNLANDKGHTPLMLAASCGNESVCEFLKDVSLQHYCYTWSEAHHVKTD